MIMSQACFEFDLIVNMENGFEIFSENWEKWKPAIIGYSQATNNKPKMLQHVLLDLDTDDPGVLFSIPHYY